MATERTVLSWKEVSVWCKQRRSWMDRMRRKTSANNCLLNDVSGYLEGGDFVMLLGPSGAGKTTFMVTLAGKSNLPNVGSVKFNGVSIKSLERNFVEIIPQKDLLMEKMTVYEHLYFMSEIRFSNNLSKHDKDARIMDIVSKMKLDKCLNTMIEHCSGGQQKLVSVASALLTDPNIIFCDEPTTGLDSTSAAIVIEMLKHLSNSGKIVLCSIHQPSSLLYYQFNKIALVSAGNLVYCGNTDQCMELFERHHMACPESYNPAEFFLNKIITKSQDDKEKLIMLQELKDDYESNLENSFSSFDYYEENSKKPRKRSRGVSWWKQIYLLLWRSSIQIRRNKRAILWQTFLDMLIAPVIGILYSGASIYKPTGLQDLNGLFYMLVADNSFTSTYSCVSIFLHNLPFYRREADFYSGSAFYLSTFLITIPRCFLYALYLLLTATWGVTLPESSYVFWEMYLILTFVSLAASTYGFAIAAVLSRDGLTFEVPVFTDLLMMLISGTYGNVLSLPKYISWFKYVSHFYLGLEALSSVFWPKVDHIFCPYSSESAATCPANGAQVLNLFGYQNNLLRDGAVIFGDMLLWSALVLLGLYREKRLGYAF